MKFHEYIAKTIKRGHFSVKFGKLCRFFIHFFYFVKRHRVGNYPSPPNGVREIGFFDKNSLIHTYDEYKGLFNPDNLYSVGRYKEMKPGAVTIAEFKGILMVRKSFVGLQKYYKFYNELICLDRLRQVQNVPHIFYVDYENLTIYLQYLDGRSFSRNRKRGKVIVNRDNYTKFYNGFKDTLKKIHKHGVIMYDLRHANMMIEDTGYYLFDFGDSLYYGKMLAPFCENLKSREKLKLKHELIASIEDESYKQELLIHL